MTSIRNVMMKTACNEVDKQGAPLNLYNSKCGLYAPTAENNRLSYNHKLSDDTMNALLHLQECLTASTSPVRGISSLLINKIKRLTGEMCSPWMEKHMEVAGSDLHLG